jgi:photosystem II stability/assembly factor-like uncharacterized protein
MKTLCASLLSLLAFVSLAQDEKPCWVNATGDLGGSEWTKSGVWKLVGVPNSSEVICSMMSLGLWSTGDGGATWKRMGQTGGVGKRPPNQGQAVQFVFDPKDSKTFWTSGMYNYAVWKTTDGGASFEKLGTHNHVDGIAVDFSDPERKTLLIGLHEQERSLHKSTDGGKTWTKIGDKLPEKSNFSTDPIIIDSKTYITSGAGWKQGLPWGIYRTEDGGETWTKVSDAGAAGNPLIASDGSIYWAVLWDGALIKSSDRGKTWAKLPGPVHGLPIELPGKRLVGVKDTQLYVSADGGGTWSAFGETLPFKPNGITYSDGRKSLLAWKSDTKGSEVIVRWDLPDLDNVFKTVAPPKLVVWDGEGFNTGNGWANGGFVKPQTNEKHSGTTALEYRVEGNDKWEGGWNWHNWAQFGLTDISSFKNLSVWMKFKGGTPPSDFKVALNCGPGKISSEPVSVAQYCTTLFDGQWHDVTIPLKDLCSKKDFDPHSTYELRIQSVVTKDAPFSVYVDDIRFDNR